MAVVQQNQPTGKAVHRVGRRLIPNNNNTVPYIHTIIILSMSILGKRQ